MLFTRCQHLGQIIWGHSTRLPGLTQNGVTQHWSLETICNLLQWFANHDAGVVNRRNSTPALDQLTMHTASAAQQPKQLIAHPYRANGCQHILNLQQPSAAATRAAWPVQVQHFMMQQLQRQAVLQRSSCNTLQWPLQDCQQRVSPSTWIGRQALRELHHSRPPAPSRRPGPQPKPKPEGSKPQLRRNQDITAAVLMVVFPDGTKQEMALADALASATSQGLDLVQVNPRAQPPVARIMDWRKFEHEQRQKEEAAAKTRRQQQKLATPKEMQFSARIADHDLEVKLKKVVVWLEQGYRVQLVVKHGREEDGAANEALDYLTARIQADYNIEASAKQAQRRAISLLVKATGAAGAGAAAKGRSTPECGVF